MFDCKPTQIVVGDKRTKEMETIGTIMLEILKKMFSWSPYYSSFRMCDFTADVTTTEMGKAYKIAREKLSA